MLTAVSDDKSFLGELSRIVRDGVQVLIWAGDSDYVCNWVGTKRVADAVDWARKKEFAGRNLSFTRSRVFRKPPSSLWGICTMREFLMPVIISGGTVSTKSE